MCLKNSKSWQLVANLVVFLHSTSVASDKSCQHVKIVGNLIDLSRHVVIDLSGCQPTKNEKSCKLVRN